jgi:hypothetical protein
MITENGKVYIKRYLAQEVTSIARSIGFGIGQNSESSADTRLQMEIERADVTLVSYDYVNDRIIYKAIIPDYFAGTIYEVGLFSLPESSTNGVNSSQIISTFDSYSELWTNSGGASTFDSTNARVGEDALRQVASASSTATDTLADIVLDLGNYSGADAFSIALDASTNVSSVKVRFLTDSSNYYEVNFGPQASGYRFATAPKGSATATGTPSWSDITQIKVITTATSGGSATVDLDALKIESILSTEADDIMIDRRNLTVPFVKEEGMSQEIEFFLNVNIA